MPISVASNITFFDEATEHNLLLLRGFITPTSAANRKTHRFFFTKSVQMPRIYYYLFLKLHLPKIRQPMGGEFSSADRS